MIQGVKAVIARVYKHHFSLFNIIMAYNDGRRPRRDFDRGPRQMHKAVCSDCGGECEVPFKQKEERPVY